MNKPILTMYRITLPILSTFTFPHFLAQHLQCRRCLFRCKSTKIWSIRQRWQAD